MSQRCLVTGGAGFLGGALVKRLQASGHDVTVLARARDISGRESPPCRVVLGDILDTSSLATAMTGVDVVFHLAAMISYTPSDRTAMFKVNVEGTRNVAGECIRQKCRMVHVSSMASIGFNPSPSLPARTEDCSYNLHQHSLAYCESKLEGERVLLDLHAHDQLDVVIINPGNIYGAGDVAKASRSTQMMVAAGRFPFYPLGGCNVVHVDDVADGMVSAMTKGRSGERYILGGDNITIKAMFGMIAEMTKVTKPFIPLPVWTQLLMGRMGMAPLEKVIPANMFCYFSSRKAATELGYRHRPAKDALEASVRWMVENSEGFHQNRAQAQASFWIAGILAGLCFQSMVDMDLLHRLALVIAGLCLVAVFRFLF